MHSDFDSNSETLFNEHSNCYYEAVTNDQIKTFICKYTGCGKIFKYKSEMERHIVTHSNSRPFTCQYNKCLKTFKRIDALESHIRACHTNKTPLACTYSDCKIKFTTCERLRRHILLHHQTVPQETLDSNILGTSGLRKQIKLNAPVEEPIQYCQPAKKIDPLPSLNLSNDFYAPTTPKYVPITKLQVSDEDVTTITEIKCLEKLALLRQAIEDNKALRKKLNLATRGILDNVKLENEVLSKSSEPQDLLVSKKGLMSENLLKSKKEVPLFDLINFGADVNFGLGGSDFGHQSSTVDSFFQFSNSFELRKTN